jgi:hypothetical protein
LNPMENIRKYSTQRLAGGQKPPPQKTAETAI